METWVWIVGSDWYALRVKLKEFLGVWGLKWKLLECKDVVTWRERLRFLSERLLLLLKRRVMRGGELMKRWW